jgi:hypothetical protein
MTWAGPVVAWRLFRPSPAVFEGLRMPARAGWLLGVLVLVSGCGDDRLAPVSGVVLLNGKPLGGARVSFEPKAPERPEFAPSSSGLTDADGRFQLRVTVNNQSGAVVGKHTVRISKPERESGPGEDIPYKEALPARYNHKTTLTFVVPRGGTAEAKFALTKP